MRYFDLHCDTAGRCFDEHQDVYDNDFQLSLKRGEIFEKWVQCMAIWIPDEYRGESAWKYYTGVYNNLISMKARPDIIKSYSEIDLNKRSFLLTIEGGSVLCGNLQNIKKIADMGVKILTLTWNGENEIGGGADTSKGISEFGIRAIFELEKNGIVIDVSHASDRLFDDVLIHSKKPFIATHSNSRKICNHRRNLTDEQFKQICKRGGIVGINFCKSFLEKNGKATPEHIIEHVEHFLSLGAENNIAIGSDFDGTDLPDGMTGIESINELYELFLRKNFSEELTDKIFYKNAFDFFTRLYK